MNETRPRSSVLELERRIQALPARKNAATRLAVIKRFKDIAVQSTAQQERALKAIESTQQVFESANLKESRAAVVRNSRTAASLIKELKEIDAVDKQSVDNAFHALQQGTAKAVTSVEQEWGKQISTVVGRFDRIVAVAQQAGLSGAEQLSGILRVIQSATKPTADDRVVRCLAELHESVRTLGLEGKGGKFLARVADGTARAKDVAEPEIAEFLTRYDLWPLLTVRFAQ